MKTEDGIVFQSPCGDLESGDRSYRAMNQSVELVSVPLRGFRVWRPFDCPGYVKTHCKFQSPCGDLESGDTRALLDKMR